MGKIEAMTMIVAVTSMVVVVLSFSAVVLGAVGAATLFRPHLVDHRDFPPHQHFGLDIPAKSV